ncbi:YggT family protein [bacterium]|nr:YggT family protein [bacterium]MCB1221682.1 YggT family protein [bacterium]UNM08987.1 MAG: YggT family protein [Planctomycetales bacterium]
MNPIQQAMIMAVTLYSYMCFIWVFGSWFPNWRYQEWFKMLSSIVEPYMNVFKGLPLRFGMFDLSPMIAIFVLYIFRSLIASIR